MASSLWYLNAPDTGTNKTAEIRNFGTSGSDAPTQHRVWHVLEGHRYCEPGTRSPMARSRDRVAAMPTRPPRRLTGSSDDLMSWVGGYSADPRVQSIAGRICQRVEGATNTNADGAWATGSPSGNTTVAASSEPISRAINLGHRAQAWRSRSIGTVALSSRTLDYGLEELNQYADKLYVCSQQPVDYTEATATYALGMKDLGVGLVFGNPADATPDGRQVSSGRGD